nr:hypothetical protein [Tanacetum cinerariifolium]
MPCRTGPDRTISVRSSVRSSGPTRSRSSPVLACPKRWLHQATRNELLQDGEPKPQEKIIHFFKETRR